MQGIDFIFAMVVAAVIIFVYPAMLMAQNGETIRELICNEAESEAERERLSDRDVHSFTISLECKINSPVTPAFYEEPEEIIGEGMVIRYE